MTPKFIAFPFFFFPRPLPELHMADVDLTRQPQLLRLKRFTSAYFLPAIFRHSLPACSLQPNAQCATLSLPSACCNISRAVATVTGRARVPMLLCPLDFFFFFFLLFGFVCPRDLWVSSCVGNPTLLRPQPVAADGKRSTGAERKKGS